MLVGLQGSGKTTTAGKLAIQLRKSGRRPFLVPADVYRPAAIDQLKKIAEQVDVPVFASTTDQDPVQICLEAKTGAFQKGCDTLIIDTAGRLHIDEELMAELGRIKETIRPADILLVADSMTGQDAVNIAKSFNDRLDISGVVLTKMDGDARGGAALSIRSITGKPIKFVGVGEKLSALEPFHPDRMASTILGMGDVLSLIEKAQETVDQKKALELQKKLRKSQFTLEDFRDQLVQVRKMGSLSDILKMIPGMGKIKELKNLEIDDRRVRPDRGDHQLHDGPGTAAARHHQRQPAPPHRDRQRHARPGRQRTAEKLHSDAEDAEKIQPRRHPSRDAAVLTLEEK